MPDNPGANKGASTESIPAGVRLARCAGQRGLPSASTLDELAGKLLGTAWWWLHLDQTHTSTQNWLRSRSGIPQPIAESLLDASTRPGCIREADGIMFIGRSVNMDPASTPEDMVSLRAWLTEKQLITVVVRRLRSAEAVADAMDQGSLDTPAGALTELIRQMLTRISPVVDQICTAFEEVQLRVIDEDIAVPTSEVASLRLRALTLHRYLAPLRDAVRELESTAPGWFPETNRAMLRGDDERLTRIVEDLATLELQASVAQDEIVSQQNQATNHRLYVLTIITALFLPLGFLTGLLGINVGGMPGAGSPTAFWWVVGGMAAVLVVQVLLLRMLKWF
ncbi:MAG: CorA family divalent cation transporter [Planctomycetota bacterium]